MSRDVATDQDYVGPSPVIEPKESYATIEKQVGGIVLKRKIDRGWLFGLLTAFGLLQVLFFSVAWLLAKGTGVWGVNIPVGWGFAIINFVWWVGIGHAGTLISAILLLLKQEWRMAIARFAEAMTLFAVACAGIFPILHTGRPWLAYWLVPYPNTMDMWPNFRSPLLWDVFAISTYATVSLLFWFVGLVPDLATLRDRAEHKFAKYFYGILAMGWRGSARHWHRYEVASLLLAGLATPLVVSVHTIVSLDFAISIVPGWHTTVFPPYFVAGAVYSGFAMVLTLVIPVRKIYKLEGLITDRHIQNMAKVMLATGLIVAYGYGMEIFIAWYGGVEFEMYMIENRMMGHYAVFYWALILCNVLSPQLLWFKKIRQNLIVLFLISLVVNVGMWLERFVIVVTSLHRDYLPSSWDTYTGTVWDWGMYIGTFGLFLTLMFIFLRVLPMISIFEVKTLVHSKEENAVTLYGILAEFPNAERLIEAADRARAEGFVEMDGFSPIPVHGLSEALGQRHTKLPWAVFAFGLMGGLGGYALQYWTSAIDYPLNIGGRPLHSWPSFIPVTFELIVLFAAFAAVFGLFIANRLPRPNHPLFAAEGFDRATSDRFFLCIEAADPKFDAATTRAFLESLGAERVTEVQA